MPDAHGVAPDGFREFPQPTSAGSLGGARRPSSGGPTINEATPLLQAHQQHPPASGSVGQPRQPSGGSHAPSEAGPDDSQVMEQLTQDAMPFLSNHSLSFGILFLVLLFWLVFSLYVFAAAFVALVNHANKPCDQPLKYYLLTAFIYLTIPQQVVQNVATPRMPQKTYLVLMRALSIPSALVLGAGLSMVWCSETCSQTNPELFYPARRMIYIQVFTMVATPLLAVASLLGLRILLLNLSSFGAGPGCARAVRALPRVRVGAPELVEEDAAIKACPICLELLSDPGKDMVRTPCGHHFHQGCLATWCSSRLTCPVCRDRIAAPDEREAPHPEGVPAAAPMVEP